MKLFKKKETDTTKRVASDIWCFLGKYTTKLPYKYTNMPSFERARYSPDIHLMDRTTKI